MAANVNGGGTVVVTGASTGIGRACALHLDGLGFEVLAGVRKPEDGERLQGEASGRLAPLRIDVTDADSIAAAGAEVEERVGDRGLAGLVNNAGVSFGGPLEFTSPDEVRSHFEVNLIGHVAVTQRLLEALRRARGRVVNMSSVGARVTAPMLGPYGMAKAGMERFTDSLRRELRPWGMWVAAVEPGSVATPIWEKGEATANELEAGMPERGHRLYGEAITALRKTARETGERGVPPEKVARAVAHALTARRPRARYLVGMDARAMVALQSLLPTRAFDAVMYRSMGLPRGAPPD
jgi:NAD(P)-dependent dehydrogenase (short-subunit alcohol dehydrogenase family)